MKIENQSFLNLLLWFKIKSKNRSPNIVLKNLWSPNLSKTKKKVKNTSYIIIIINSIASQHLQVLRWPWYIYIYIYIYVISEQKFRECFIWIPNEPNWSGMLRRPSASTIGSKEASRTRAWRIWVHWSVRFALIKIRSQRPPEYKYQKINMLIWLGFYWIA